MQKHEYFKQLCALRGTGELSPEEEADVREHLTECETCREAQEAFATILGELPATSEVRIDRKILRQSDLNEFRQGFVQHAPREGVRFSDEAQAELSRGRWALPMLPWRVSWGSVSWVAGGLLWGITFGALGYAKLHNVHSESSLVVLPPPAITNSEHVPSVAPPPISESVEPQGLDRASEKIITGLKTENGAMSARLADIEKRLSASESENQTLRQVLTRTNDANAQLSATLEQNAALLAEAKSEVEKARSGREAALAELSAQKTEVNVLSEQLRLENASLDQQRQLIAAGRDVSDLMGARNLHMIDVRDADGTGKDRRSFGRVFYTEGKSLIFYAFDLDEKKLVDAKYKFEAWGERLGQPSSVKSLGILYADDKAQRRWVLKVDDPRQIAQIDSVFVTLEPHNQDGEAPRGKRVLYAFLGGAPNHP